MAVKAAGRSPLAVRPAPRKKNSPDPSSRLDCGMSAKGCSAYTVASARTSTRMHLSMRWPPAPLRTARPVCGNVYGHVCGDGRGCAYGHEHGPAHGPARRRMHGHARRHLQRDTFCGNTPLGKDGSSLRRAMNPHTRIDAPVCALVCMHGYPQVHVLASQCTLVYTG